LRELEGATAKRTISTTGFKAKVESDSLPFVPPEQMSSAPLSLGKSQLVLAFGDAVGIVPGSSPPIKYSCEARIDGNVLGARNVQTQLQFRYINLCA
jgi:hypothetical protein